MVGRDADNLPAEALRCFEAPMWSAYALRRFARHPLHLIVGDRACLAEALEWPEAAGSPPSRLRRFGETAFALEARRTEWPDRRTLSLDHHHPRAATPGRRSV
jgi:hypothetical protein